MEEKKKRKARRLKAATGPPIIPGEGMVCQRVKIDGTTYELTYIKCGPRCRVCAAGSPDFDPGRPGHGPYWYARYRKVDGGQGRRYIGRSLMGPKGPRAVARSVAPEYPIEGEDVQP